MPLFAPTAAATCSSLWRHKGVQSAAVARPPGPYGAQPSTCCRLSTRALQEEATALPHGDGTLTASSTGPASFMKQHPHATELDEAEIARRRKISEANTGRVPWNKGRKHSPETIAKIKARSEEAMRRPECMENFKKAMALRQQTHSEETKAKIGAKVRAYNEAKRIREGKPPKPEEPPKRQRKPRSKAVKADTEAVAADVDVAPGEAGPSTQPTKSAKRRPRKTEATAVEGQDAAEPKKPKTRSSNSEAHKQAIREAIRAKWKDPEYRELMCRRMKEAAQRKWSGAAVASDTSQSGTSSSGRAGGSSSGSNEAGSNGTPAQTKQQQQAWLQQVQGFVEQLLTSQKLLETMDSQVAGMKAQAGAFVNDPVMLNRLEAVMTKVEARRQQLAEGVAAQQAKIPANVGFDHLGRVYVKPETSQSPASPSPAPASPLSHHVTSSAQLLGHRLSSRPEQGLYSSGVVGGLSAGDQMLYSSLRGRIGGMEVLQRAGGAV